MFIIWNIVHYLMHVPFNNYTYIFRNCFYWYMKKALPRPLNWTTNERPRRYGMDSADAIAWSIGYSDILIFNQYRRLKREIPQTLPAFLGFVDHQMKLKSQPRKRKYEWFWPCWVLIIIYLYSSFLKSLHSQFHE